MKYDLNDVLSGGSQSKTSSQEVRLPCLLGDKCEHKDSVECDSYRQELLFAEHKKTCPEGENCTHFVEGRGVPEFAKWRGESPADFLKRTRGVS